jgi:hypothetical protein
MASDHPPRTPKIEASRGGKRALACVPSGEARQEPYSQWARGYENPAVNESVAFVPVNPCFDVHQDGT